jgi:hypothetical protein
VPPLRPGSAKAGFEETIEKMLKAAQRFDAGKIPAEAVARSGGPPED